MVLCCICKNKLLSSGGVLKSIVRYTSARCHCWITFCLLEFGSTLVLCLRMKNAAIFTWGHWDYVIFGSCTSRFRESHLHRQAWWCQIFHAGCRVTITVDDQVFVFPGDHHSSLRLQTKAEKCQQQILRATDLEGYQVWTFNMHMTFRVCDSNRCYGTDVDFNCKPSPLMGSSEHFRYFLLFYPSIPRACSFEKRDSSLGSLNLLDGNSLWTLIWMIWLMGLFEYGIFSVNHCCHKFSFDYVLRDSKQQCEHLQYISHL